MVKTQFGSSKIARSESNGEEWITTLIKDPAYRQLVNHLLLLGDCPFFAVSKGQLFIS